jgi:hypothetical protein
LKTVSLDFILLLYMRTASAMHGLALPLTTWHGIVGKTVYEWRTPGVLTYSETMSRPLSFLAPYIGAAKANNPLGLGDNDIVV